MAWKRLEMADVEWAAEIAGLSEDIAGFPDRFDALVGERGITLSGGQKQRTAIARAVLRELEILTSTMLCRRLIRTRKRKFSGSFVV